MQHQPVITRDRIESKYEPEPMSGCWLWIGTIADTGYGVLSVREEKNGKQSRRYAHRISYELFVGPIPVGLEIDHKCRVRSCINPDHLEPVTRRENLRRGIQHNRLKTKCPRGHQYTEHNTYVNKVGARVCRACCKMWDDARSEPRKQRRAEIKANACL
jgi:hypothetical protein